MRFARLVVALLLVAFAGACADDTAAPPADGGDSDADGSGNGVLYETCPTTCTTTPTCPAGQILTCCTCIEPPTANAGRTPCGQMSEYCDEAPPNPINVACLTP